MAYEFAMVERDGPLTLITLNRPEVLNALHPPAALELDAIWNDFAADDSQWIAIVTGAGDRAFCAGNDLKYQAASEEIAWVESGFAGLTSRFDLNKPVIAAVNGVAMGGGFEIALACDIVIADERAVFALPEPRVGLAALGGGVHRLPRIIGEAAALGLILTGRRVSAAEGERMGFVTAVAPAGQCVGEAKKWARQILECSPMSVRASKEALRRGLTERSVQVALERQATYPAVVALFQSEDFVEGPRAFAQKRPPRWTGR